MKRASKRLINAIIALVASVILCIGMCLAWFAMNNDVSGNGMQTQVKGSDIVSFDVEASYLDFFSDTNKTDFKKATNGNVSTSDKTFDKDNNGTFNVSSENGNKSNDEMRSFDSTKMYSSAVVFKVDYEILAGSDKSFRIYATCPYTTEHLTENVFTVVKDSDPENDTYYSSVSNAVFLSEASLSDGKYTVKSSSETEAYNVKFIKEDYTKNFTKYLKTGIENKSTAENLKGTLYYVMDYDETLFSALTNSMLTLAGTLNSRITLDGDVIFGIEEYTSETPTVEAVTFVNSTSITTQAAGSDVMTASWQFLLEKSDATLETVKYNASSFTVDESFSTASTGSKTVTIKYGDIDVQFINEEGKATTEIPYTIVTASTVTGITLNKYTLSLIYDSKAETSATAQLTATISPSDATNKTVIWTSSNTSVATVSSTGLVTATGAGEAVITAKSDANNEITTKCIVTVTASSSATAVTGVTLDRKTLALYINSSVTNANKATLKATITPENATNKDVTWTSSDPTVATVDGSGNVTALNVGITNVTVTTSDGGFTATCSVIVKDATSSISVTGVSLDKTTLSLTVGAEQKLTASITPNNATITNVSWSSSDNTVATVSSTGVVTAKKAGTAIITVTTADGGKTATCTVTVTDSSTVAVTGVTLNKTSTSITVGSSETLTATVKPEGATNKAVSWSSSDDTVATVDDSGNVTALKAGTATITVTTADGGKTATCTVTVTAAATTEYTVTFDMNGHGTQIGSVKTVDGKISKPTEPTAVGYTFGGWYLNADCTGTAIDFDSYTFEESTTVYAKWTIMDYTANGTYEFDVGGGAGSSIFAGTAISSDGGYDTNKTQFKIGSGDYITVVMRLQVGKVITITGSALPANTSATTSFTITEGTGNTGKVDSYGNELSVTGDTATAINYTIKVTTEGIIVLHLDRGKTRNTGCLIKALSVTISDPAATTSHNVTFKNGDETLQTGTVAEGNKPTYSGETPTKASTAEYTYTFSGWSSDGGTTVYTTANLPEVTADVTYFAQFNPATRQYTVTFMDGSSQHSQSKVNYNATVTKPENPEKTGYTFVQWCSDQKLTTEFDFANTAITSDTTIYAKWTINTYTVTYHLDEGTNDEANIGTYTVETAKFTLKNPTKANYSFDGWYTESTFVNKVTTIAGGSTGDFDLYAKWTISAPKITHSFTDSDLSSDNKTITYDCITITTGDNDVFKNVVTKDSFGDVSWTNILYRNDSGVSLIIKSSVYAKITIYCRPCSSGGTGKENGTVTSEVSIGSIAGDIKVDGSTGATFNKSNNTIVTVEATLLADGTCTIKTEGKRLGIVAIIIEKL